MNTDLNDSIQEIKQRLLAYSKELEIQQKAEFYTAKAKETIQNYPIPSLLTGLAIGFILGRLLSDSDDSTESKVK